MALRVRENFDIDTLSGALSIEALIESIQNKPESQRSSLEKQILSLYSKAESEGRSFCKGQIIESIKEWYSSNPLLVIGGGIALGFIIYKAVK